MTVIWNNYVYTIFTIKNRITMKKIKLLSMLFVALTFVFGFASCDSDPDPVNKEELFKDFIGEWTFTSEILFDGVKSEIQGECKYNTDKTVEVIQSHYKEGVLFSEGKYIGKCFITISEDYYELNTKINDCFIGFEDIKIGYNGKYENKKSNGNYYSCTFDKTNGIISIIKNYGSLEFKIEIKKK